MKIIIQLLPFLLLKISDSKVYICGTTGAKKYHYSENCRELNSCKHEIYKVSLNEAKGYGLTLCDWED